MEKKTKPKIEIIRIGKAKLRGILQPNGNYIARCPCQRSGYPSEPNLTIVKARPGRFTAFCRVCSRASMLSQLGIFKP